MANYTKQKLVDVNRECIDVSINFQLILLFIFIPTHFIFMFFVFVFIIVFGIYFNISAYLLIYSWILHRGKMLVLTQLFWASGSFILIAAASVIIPNFGWRWLMIFTAVLTWLSLAFFKVFYLSWLSTLLVSTGWLIDWLIDRLIDCSTYWSSDWLIDRLIDWLIVVIDRVCPVDGSRISSISSEQGQTRESPRSTPEDRQSE